MKKATSIFLLFFLSVSMSVGQVNLVPNYSFEAMDTFCNTGGINMTPPWISPTGGSPECFKTCAVFQPNYLVPQNIWGYQWPRTGIGYAGFGVWCDPLVYPDAREYIQVRLTDTLKENIKYKVNFYVNLSDSSWYATDDIGAYFSDTAIYKGIADHSPFNSFIPQIENQNGNIITDKINWVLISGIYKAHGGEQYITIGNFYNDANTDTLKVSYGGSSPAYGLFSLYYIDDIYVYLYEVAEAGNNQTICSGDNVQIGTAPKSGCAYYWQPATGLSNDSIANPIANPQTTTIYYLQQTDFMNEITYDTVTITVIENCDTISTDYIFIPNIFSPNNDGNNDVLYVRSHNIKTMDFCIYNRWGEKVFESKDINKGWDGRYNGGACNEGVFVWYLNATLKNDKAIVKKGNVTLMR